MTLGDHVTTPARPDEELVLLWVTYWPTVDGYKKAYLCRRADYSAFFKAGRLADVHLFIEGYDELIPWVGADAPVKSNV